MPRVIQVWRRRFYVLALLALSLSAVGMVQLWVNVSRIEAALPLTSLYRERDFSAFFHDLTRLEAALQLAAAVPTEKNYAALDFALDLAALRQRDNIGVYGESGVEGLDAFNRELAAVLARLDTLSASQPPDSAGLSAELERMSALRRELQSLNDALFQSSMEQASRQRTSLGELRQSMSALIVLLGAFGLGLAGLLLRQQRSIRALEQRDGELRAGEAVQRELRERLEKIADNVPGVIYQYRQSVDGRSAYPYASQGIRALFGVSPEEVRRDGNKVLAAIHPEDRERVKESLLLSAQTLQPWNCEYRVARQESPVWVSAYATPQLEGDGSVLWHGYAHDVSRHKAAEDEIRQLAFYDPLTGLPNRRLLMDRLRHALAGHVRGQRHGALLFIDLDNFKTLNDTQGHEYGDHLLCQVAERLVASVRGADTVARLGGDEFVVMLEDLSAGAREAVAAAEAVGDKILLALNSPYTIAGREFHSTPSIGITLFDAADQHIDELLKRADLAMYQAKEAGRNTLRFFDPAMQAEVAAYSALESDLRQALREGQFLLHYQPQLDRGGKATGAEALLRWHHPVRGNIPPSEFIALAERSGLIVPIGRWVLETACRQLAAWAQLPDTAQLTLAVNVSVRQFRHPDFVDLVVGALDRSGADPLRLKLELTESLLLDDVEEIVAKMTRLKQLGVGFSLDDFGTGYSSLAYLKRLPIEQLKIDRSFVRDVLTDPNDAVIARTIIALGQSLGLSVMAEGVETEAQYAFLSRHGCEAFQGFLFGQPKAEWSLLGASPAGSFG
ncbi:EAL domain-containing protein [Azoarcus indigens]|uniref:PAS domain S-box-containing protein/diguanylate cyclase (GGDEF)-like protein n=1 Tax=Azoarcus indigens TaxID=29545 RepID=A0A4R6DMG9_9RHOO|nr:GGDEF domain-containing phosphodiesterase [Azoarcus indigens]NMG67696.1 EAL domain-containing protein [Azoarcus indigens]TDN45509.1 PAS domain S-box-containing protein/diguanylate cyclase (GGDEF)-like protein [Azoarcus indigens]